MDIQIETTAHIGTYTLPTWGAAVGRRAAALTQIYANTQGFSMI